MLFNNLKRYAVGIALLPIACFVLADPYLYNSVCPKGPDGNPGGSVYSGYWNVKDKYYVDKWNFAQCNCTSYVANRINMNGIAFSNNDMVKSGDGSSESSWGKRLWNLVPDGRYFRCPDCGNGFTPCPPAPYDPVKDAEMKEMMRR